MIDIFYIFFNKNTEFWINVLKVNDIFYTFLVSFKLH